MRPVVRAPAPLTAVPDTVGFYRDALGFALMAQLEAQAAFLSAGGYHHHIGANTRECTGERLEPLLGVRFVKLAAPRS